MAVKIRLKRLGKIRVPQYRIVVVDSRKKRDGRVLEEIGKYHPKEDPSYIDVKSERAQYWLGVGAQPTEPVEQILKITGDWQKFKGLPGAEGTLKTKDAKRDKIEIFNEALKEAAGILEAAGAVTGDYFEAMKAREETVSTFMGNGLAIPHGTDAAKDAVLGSALAVIRYDGGVEWGDGDVANFVVGIAGKGDAHLEILQSVAIQFGDDDTVARLKAAETPEELYTLLKGGMA